MTILVQKAFSNLLSLVKHLQSNNLHLIILLLAHIDDISKTFEGIKEGYNFTDLPDSVIEKEFAENQLMEIAQYFIPEILNTTKTTKQIF